MRSVDNAWCILRTAGRSTLGLAESLKADGFEAWTPAKSGKFRVPRANFRRDVTLPLMPGYVFVRSCHLPDMVERSFLPDAVFSIFRHLGEIRCCTDAELEPLRLAEHNAIPKARLRPYDQGSLVRITGGSCEGMTGVVERSNGRECELWVTLFGRHHRVKINTFILQPIMANGGFSDAAAQAA